MEKSSQKYTVLGYNYWNFTPISFCSIICFIFYASLLNSKIYKLICTTRYQKIMSDSWSAMSKNAIKSDLSKILTTHFDRVSVTFPRDYYPSIFPNTHLELWQYCPKLTSTAFLIFFPISAANHDGYGSRLLEPYSEILGKYDLIYEI